MLKRLFQFILKQDSFIRKRAWQLGKIFTFACFLFVFLFATHSVFTAAGPSIITYQGKLLEGGSSVTTTKAMKFVIYTDSTGGTAVYTASGTLPSTSTIGVTPTNGIFSIDLGGSGTNNLSESVFNASELWLEVTVDGTTLSPRKRLTSVPFAVNSARLNGVSATSTAATSTYIPISGSDGSFTFNTTTVAYLFGTTVSTTDLLIGNSITLGGETRTTWPTLVGGSSSTVFADGGGYIYAVTTTNKLLLGAGTTSTNALLEVRGTAYFDDLVTFNNGVAGISSSDLSDMSTLAFLAGTQTFTGSNTFNATTTFATTTFNGLLTLGGGISGLSSGDLNDASSLAYLGNTQIFTGLNTFTATSTFASSTFDGDIVFNSGITIGGVRRTTWPAGGGGGDSLFVDGGGYLYPTTSTYPVVIGSNVTSTAGIFEVNGDASLLGTTNLSTTSFFSGLGNISNYTTTSVAFTLGSAVNGERSGLLALYGNDTNVAGFMINNNGALDEQAILLAVEEGSAVLKLGNDNTTYGSLEIHDETTERIYLSGTSTADSYINGNIFLGGGTIESITTSSFVMNGDDVYVHDLLGVGNRLYVENDIFTAGTSTAAEFVTTGGITLGGERRTTWPASVTQNFVDTGTFLRPNTTTYPLVLGTSTRSRSELLEVQGDGYFSDTVTFATDIAFTGGMTVGHGNNNWSENVAIGSNVLPNLTLGKYTVAIGANTLTRVGSAGGNTVVGYNGLRYINAAYNTAVGTYAMQGPTTGTRDGEGNTAIGHRSMEAINTGDGNVSLGASSATALSTGDNNIVIGGSSAVNLTSGNGNTILGTLTAAGLVTGSNNTIIGASVTGLSSSLSSNIILADGQGRQRIRVLSNGYVGINTTTPGYQFTVDGETYLSDSLHLGDNSEISFTSGGVYTWDFDNTLNIVGADGVSMMLSDEITFSGASAFNDVLAIGTSTSALDAFTLFVDGDTNLNGSTQIGDTLYVDADTNNVGINTSSPNYDFTVDGDVFISGTTTLTGRTDLRGNALSPVPISTYQNATQMDGALAMAFVDEYLYTGGYNFHDECTNCDNNIVIFDTSDPSNLSVVKEINNGDNGIDLDGGIWNMMKSGDILYLVRGSIQNTTSLDALILLDVSDPVNPVLLSELEDDVFADMDGITEMDIEGNYVYLLSARDDNMIIIDVSNPRDPQYMSSITNSDPDTMLDGPFGIDVKGRYAYIISQTTDGLSIIDISDPKNPVGVGTLANGDGGAEFIDPWDIEVIGNVAYIVNGIGNSLQLVNVSDPNNPSHISRLDNNTELSGVLDLDVSGNYVYTIAQNGGFSVIDVSVLTDPQLVHNIPTGGDALLNTAIRTALNGNYAYVTSLGSSFGNVNGTGGLQVFDLRSVDVINTDIGSARIGRLNVDTRSRFNSDVEVNGGLTIGRNGLLVRGDTSFGSAVSNGQDSATTTLNFANTTLFKSSVSTTDSAYIFNTVNTLTSNTKLLTIQNNTSEYLTILGNGNVGIGTSLPNYKLSVDGSGFIMGNILVGTSTENIGNTGFELDGDDLFVGDQLGVEGDVSIDGKLYVGNEGLNSDGTITGIGGWSLLGGGLFIGDTYFGAASESIANTGFVLDGNDVYFADKVGIEGNTYFDGDIFAPTTTQLRIGSPVLNGSTYKVAVEGAISASGNIISQGTLWADDDLYVVGTSLFGGALTINNTVSISDGLTVGATTTVTGTLLAQSLLDSEGTFEFDLVTTDDQLVQVCRNTAEGVGNDTEFRECDAGGSDVAEYYDTQSDVEPGDIVMTTSETITYEENLYDPLTGAAKYTDTIEVDGTRGRVTKLTTIPVLAKANYTTGGTIIGVVSTNPNLRLGSTVKDVAKKPQPIAIVGRVPVNVVPDGGSIAIGDPLTISDIPGKARKASSGDPVIGIALDVYADTVEGQVMVALTMGASGVLEATAIAEMNEDVSGTTDTTELTISQTSNGQLSFQSGRVSFGGRAISDVLAIASADETWSISIEGFFTTRIETSQGSKDFYALQSEQTELVLSGSSRLEGGLANVDFDAIYKEIIDATQPIKVTVTLTDDANGVYVTDKNVEGFMVHELANGSSDATFDWVAIVYRKAIKDTDVAGAFEEDGEDTNNSSTPITTSTENVVDDVSTTTSTTTTVDIVDTATESEDNTTSTTDFNEDLETVTDSDSGTEDNGTTDTVISEGNNEENSVSTDIEESNITESNIDTTDTDASEQQSDIDSGGEVTSSESSENPGEESDQSSQ